MENVTRVCFLPYIKAGEKQDEKSAWLLSIRSLGTGFIDWVLEVKSESGVGVTCPRTELVAEPDPSPPRIH